MLFFILFPFALLYGFVTRVRNLLYDIGWKKSSSFPPAVISVGNLSVGGTGKTPMIEYLVNKLAGQYSIAILSRGYGRSTRGFLVAEKHDDASTIGDEPFQFYRKYGNQIIVAVCESRVEGITKLLKRKPDLKVVLLDDAFQHRAVKPLFSILLTDFSRPFFKDYLLPKGRLREPRTGSKRADVVVVTKCNVMQKETEFQFRESIALCAGEKPIFFSSTHYQVPVSVAGNGKLFPEVILVTGIANSSPMVEYISSRYTIAQHFQFKDHHHYSVEEISAVQKACGPNRSILTTEKDFVKLISPDWSRFFKKELWFYVPIKTYILNSGAEFDKLITEKINSHLSKSVSKMLQ